ncbi:MAG: hypothetical protein IKI58_08080 [Oscillospiraceae bacterium]|nr:hypothetical protein [Oscillospiraceae bacterium]
MPVIPVSVCGLCAEASGFPHAVNGNSDYTVQFTFDNMWADFPEKHMQVRASGCGASPVLYDVPFTGNTVPLPPVYGAAEIEIAVYAGNIRTAAPARIPCAACITDLQGEPRPQPVNVYDMLMDRLNSILNPRPAQGKFILCDAEGFIILDSSGSMIVVKE